jgi:predicted glycoside hydrolase/deacetylase ChbG (UPF0249 family)
VDVTAAGDPPVEATPEGGQSKLAEALGYPPGSRLVIVNCDDLGSSHAANAAIYAALRRGTATSATLMVPCPWAREAAAAYRGEDVGVHLTLNCEYDLYRWGPITHAPSLLDGDGGLPRTLEDLWDHADLDETYRELAAQIERAILWGFDVTHLDSHMGPLQLRSEFFDIYLRLAVDFRLPLRLTGRWSERLVGFPFRQLADEAGVLAPDELMLVTKAGGVGSREDIATTLANLRPGVTEIQVHPACDTPELRAMTPDWSQRVDDYRLLVEEDWLLEELERREATLIGYREIRDLMRA